LLARDYSRGRLPLRLSPLGPELHPACRLADARLPQFQGRQAPAALRLDFLPCGRLSRPPTTTAAPTLPRFHRRILASVSGKPLTFMTADSTRLFRWRLPADPSRSSRNPERRQVRSGALPKLAAGRTSISNPDQQVICPRFVRRPPLCFDSATQGRSPCSRLD
jgi:hypothetical protein